MTRLAEERIAAVLDEIHDPCSIATGDPLGLREMGLVERIDVAADGAVHVGIRLTSPTCIMVGLFRSEIEDRLRALGAPAVEVSFDGGLDWSPDDMTEEVRRRRAARLAAR